MSAAEVGQRLTWEQLVKLEPELGRLLERAKATKSRGKHFCANARWYGFGQWRFAGLKPRLLWLVGWQRPDKHPVLSSTEAYDLAYETVYEALPNCRDCWCL